MIPIYFPDVDREFPLGGGVLTTGHTNLPTKNPIYFVRKSIGTASIGVHSMIVLNQDIKYSLSDLIPGAVVRSHDHPDDGAYDIESVDFEHQIDFKSDPSFEVDGSVATEPRHLYTIITFKGFVRGLSFDDLQNKINFLTYSFDPSNNYLEGASTWDNTIEPEWQPFENAGFSALLWYKPIFQSFAAGHPESLWEGSEAVDPHDDLLPYSRLNRMMFVRSIARPVNINTKFSDFNAPFEIKLLAVDPAIYEWISPSAWLDDIFSSPMLIDVVCEEGNEDFILPSHPWRVGPGWREVYSDTPV